MHFWSLTARCCMLVAALLLHVASTPAGPALAQSGEATVAAAADLQFALPEVAAAFKEETGRTVQISFGSSGNFARQIKEGAPFEVFFSADENFVFDLVEAGLARDRGARYATGRIVLIVPNGSPLEPDGTLADLAEALGDDRLVKFAIANPEHAPYGKRAEEALRRKGLWDAIKPKLVFGENVAQTAQFATSANAQGGIIAYSLALAPKVKALGKFALIPAEWHEPLHQRMVLTHKAGTVAAQFYAFATAPRAREIFRRYGFMLPAETVTAQ